MAPRGNSEQTSSSASQSSNATTTSAGAGPSKSITHDRPQPASTRSQGRMKRMLGRRNSLSLQQVMPTPFVLDSNSNSSDSASSSLVQGGTGGIHVGDVSEDGVLVDSPSPFGAFPAGSGPADNYSGRNDSIAATAAGVSAIRPGPPPHHPSSSSSTSSKKPLRSFLPSVFHSHSASSVSNTSKRSVSSDVIKAKPIHQKSGPPPPLPPPKPSNLRIVHGHGRDQSSISTSLTSRSASSGALTSSAHPSPAASATEFPLSSLSSPPTSASATSSSHHHQQQQSETTRPSVSSSRTATTATTTGTSNYIPSSDFQFPPRPAGTTSSSSVAHFPSAETTPILDIGPHTQVPASPSLPVDPTPQSPNIRNRFGNALNIRKRRSTSLGDITAMAGLLPTGMITTHNASSSISRAPMAHAAGFRSADSIVMTGSGSGESGDVASSNARTRAESSAMSPSSSLLSAPAPSRTLASSTSAVPTYTPVSAPASMNTIPPPRHPLGTYTPSTSTGGAGISINVPPHTAPPPSTRQNAAHAANIARSASPFKETARSAAGAGLMLGRKGWAGMERLIGGMGGSGHSHSQSALPGFGGEYGDSNGASSSSNHARTASHVLGFHSNSSKVGSNSDLGHTGLGLNSGPAGLTGEAAKMKLKGLIRPARRTGGLVFGRALAEVVRDTALDPSSVEADGWVDENGRKRGEHLPALVVRCVQHLEMWGVQEEGLFRISGRNTHTSKLRAEFDAGADYDLRKCNPGDLDPHSVSSVFKNFLRELPGNILTRPLVPRFREIISNFVEDMTGPKAFSPQLIHELHTLVWQLPIEHRSLLHELSRLLRRTADHASTTKMPLSNLVVVFCPTLDMNGNLLTILVEAQDQLFDPTPIPLPEPLSNSDARSELGSDATTTSEGSEQEVELQMKRRTPILHQRSISEMKLAQLTDMSRRNDAFGRLPPRLNTNTIGVPISASNSSAPSTSASTSYTSSDALSSSTTSTTESSELASPQEPSPSVQASAALWERKASGGKHAHNASMPLPAALTTAFADPFSPTLTPPIGSSISSVPFTKQRDRQGSTTTMSTLDEEGERPAPRSRTPSTLRALGAMLTGKTRSNTSLASDYAQGAMGPDGSTPTTPTRRGFSKWSPSPSTPGRLSRRSSSFFPSPRPEGPDWGMGSASPGGSLPSRARKGSVGNLRALISSPLELTPESEKEKENTRPPHLSMIIPGGGTGEFLTSPLPSLGPPSPTARKSSSPTPSPVLGPSRKSVEFPPTALHTRMGSNGTVTPALNKRWSGASSSSKRWSGTGSTTTARSKGSKRASWNELQPPAWLATPPLVDNTPAQGSVGPAAGASMMGAAGSTIPRSGTPIADLFRARSSSTSLDVAPEDKPVGKVDSSMARGRSGSVALAGLLPVNPTSSPASATMLDSPVSGRSRSGSTRLLPQIPANTIPASSASDSFPNVRPSGQVQSAIAALTHVQHQQQQVAGLSAVPPKVTTTKRTNPTLTVPGADANGNDELPPRLSFGGGVRKKHWSRTSPVNTTPVAGNGTSLSISSGNNAVEDDWASTVLAQLAAGAEGVRTPGPGAIQQAGSSAGSASSSATQTPSVQVQSAPPDDDAPIVEASSIRDGTVRDARRMFETGKSDSVATTPTSPGPGKTRTPIPAAFIIGGPAR